MPTTIPPPIVTEIVPATHFWRAEEYHQRYFDKHQGHYSCHFIRGWVPAEPVSYTHLTLPTIYSV